MLVSTCRFRSRSGAFPILEWAKISFQRSVDRRFYVYIYMVWTSRRFLVREIIHFPWVHFGPFVFSQKKQVARKIQNINWQIGFSKKWTPEGLLTIMQHTSTLLLVPKHCLVLEYIIFPPWHSTLLPAHMLLVVKYNK